ncbi:MAG: hypothetical protein A3I49_01500 [Candidatus Levybacteria bacterium RIFCSPLOWO2_02_FULL_37_11]|nr:MAG: hypothetical protein A3I49_01500 [Candidatus Levybacteria bacterium RIFCSPLOWO2_02_FULL_37_11]
MFKKIGVAIIYFYQRFLSIILKNVLGVSSFCKYDLSCSEYTKKMISKKGFFIGSALGFKRIVSCI